MFEKIVLATDLSPAWDELIDCATEFRHSGLHPDNFDACYHYDIFHWLDGESAV